MLTTAKVRANPTKKSMFKPSFTSCRGGRAKNVRHASSHPAQKIVAAEEGCFVWGGRLRVELDPVELEHNNFGPLVVVLRLIVI